MNGYIPQKPKFSGIKVSNIPIKKSGFVDWKPFFQSWELHGNFPEILSDDKVGKAATDLWNDAKKMIDYDHEKIVKPMVIGFWPANSVLDDINNL